MSSFKSPNFGALAVIMRAVMIRAVIGPASIACPAIGPPSITLAVIMRAVIMLLSTAPAEKLPKVFPAASEGLSNFVPISSNFFSPPDS
jgi:hypothetical protein